MPLGGIAMDLIYVEKLGH